MKCLLKGGATEIGEIVRVYFDRVTGKEIGEKG